MQKKWIEHARSFVWLVLYIGTELFPLWPRLATKDYSDARKKLTKGTKNPASSVDGLFRFLQWRGRESNTESVSRTIASKLCPLLDPAQCDPNEVISSGSKSFTVRDLDERFCLSVGQGQSLIRRRIPAIEKEILERLAKADDYLGSDSISNQDARKAERLQAVSVNLHAV